MFSSHLLPFLALTAQDPPSLARFLTHSERFRARFGEVQRAAAVQVLQHLGWRPARIDSKKRPLGRFCMRLQHCFETLALEADETSDKKRRDTATSLLQAFSGANTSRLVLAGMIADLAHEHAVWVRAFDVDSPEPTSIKMATQTFVQRIRLLFRDGVILTHAAQDTFTGKVLEFLKEAGSVHCVAFLV